MKRPKGEASRGITPLTCQIQLGQVNPHGEKRPILIDFGSCISLMSKKVYEGLENPPKLMKGRTLKGETASGSFKMDKIVIMPVFFFNQKGSVQLDIEFWISPFDTGVNLLIGLDWLVQYQVETQFNDMEANLLIQRKYMIPASITTIPVAAAIKIIATIITHPFPKDDNCRMARDMTIPARTVVRVPIEAYFPESQPTRFFKGKTNIPGLTLIDALISGDTTHILIGNDSDEDKELQGGLCLGSLLDPERFLEKIEEKYRPHLVAAVKIMEELHLPKPKNEPPPDPPEPIIAYQEDEIILKEELLKTVHIDPQLSPGQQEQLRKLVSKHHEAFGLNDRLGKPNVEVEIELKEDAKPAHQPVYHATPRKREEIDQTIDKWLKLDLIQSSKSPWGSPVVVVFSGGKSRVCIDLRYLNKQTKPDAYPLPRQTDILRNLRGSKIFSVCDLNSGYYQFKLKESSRPLTAFKTHRGLYEFKVMPLGVINGPPIFQRFMNELFASILWNYILVYIDDLIIYSQSFKEHLVHLERVFEILIEAKITLSPKKCFFGYQSVTILGQNISRLGLSALKDKVQAISDMPPPTNLKELRTAMGIFQYYAAYIPFASTLMAPFYKMMRKGETFNWNEDKQELFEALKDTLRSSPILIYGNDQEPYRIYSDASKFGIAATLQQLYKIKLVDMQHTRIYAKCKQAFEKGEPVPNFLWKPPENLRIEMVQDQWAENFEDTEITLEGMVAAVSRTYSAAELNYAATEMEALALIYGLLKFMPRIESAPQILCITDHVALMFMGIFKDTGRLARWGAIISKLAPRLNIIHKEGRVHNNVDTLSRRLGIKTRPYYHTPVEIPNSNLKREDKDYMLKQYEKEVDLVEVAAVTTKLDWNQEFLNRIIANYDSDVDTKEIFENIKNETDMVNPKYSNYYIDDYGLLIFKDADDKERIFVPEGMKTEVLKMVHDDLPQGGHGGPLKTSRQPFIAILLEKDGKRCKKICAILFKMSSGKPQNASTIWKTTTIKPTSTTI